MRDETRLAVLCRLIDMRRAKLDESEYMHDKRLDSLYLRADAIVKRMESDKNVATIIKNHIDESI